MGLFRGFDYHSYHIEIQPNISEIDFDLFSIDFKNKDMSGIINMYTVSIKQWNSILKGVQKT